MTMHDHIRSNMIMHDRIIIYDGKGSCIITHMYVCIYMVKYEFTLINVIIYNHIWLLRSCMLLCVDVGSDTI